ncbi:hypothetical protein [Massilia sp. YMA4]|uniref:hypothetical protein n=1 Tax=Massilia sp. YMA4 TaxID=1593482 RepID=UPI000DD171C1|nr:hypothetical protein [Massilia sp. YMA4]AXA92851.1 hypothetical protein DPH57_17870 [Massilia sp. YMA4]
MSSNDSNVNGAPNQKDRQVNTDVEVGQTGGKRLPHERDESTQGVEHQRPRTRIEQAARDIDQGLVDTDLRETRGIQKAPPGNGDAQAKPLPEIKRD